MKRSFQHLSSIAALMFLSLASACPNPTRPMVFARIELVRARSDVMAAQGQSPALFAKGESLRARAEASFKAKDLTSADLLGEHAIAAYMHAVVAALHTEAIAHKNAAEQELKRVEAVMESDDQLLRETDRAADRLEHEIIVRREALSPSKSKKASGMHELARRIVVKLNLSTGSSLCEGARVLGVMAKKEVPLLAEAVLTLKKVAATNAVTSLEAPIDDSMRARALCLRALTRARDLVTPLAGSNAEAILQELQTFVSSQEASLQALSLRVARDERGVFLMLSQANADHAMFVGKSPKFAPLGQSVLEVIARLAKANKNFGLLVIVHASPGDESVTRDQSRAEAIKKELIAQGLDPLTLATQTLGASRPAFDVNDARKKQANERVEFLFVGPTK